MTTKTVVNICRCLPIFTRWDFQGLGSLGLALLKSVGEQSVTVAKAELAECRLLLKVFPSRSDFLLSATLTYKEFVAVKICEQVFGRGEHFP